MALGYGLGLGLQGTPKDYVEVARSREAAKQKYDLEKMKKSSEDIDRMVKELRAKTYDKTVLPVHEKAKERAFAEALLTIESNLENPNRLLVDKATTKAISDINNYHSQFNIFKQIQQNPGNYGIAPEDVEVFTEESDPQRIAERLNNGVGSISFDPNTNFISIKKLGKYQPASQQVSNYVKENADFIFYDKERGAPQKTTILGTEVNYFGMAPEAKDMFLRSALVGDNFESNRREYRRDKLTRGEVPEPQGSPEEFDAVVNYVSGIYDQAASTLLKDERFRQSKGITINNLIGDRTEEQPGTPDFNPRTNVILSSNPAFPNGTEYTALGTYSIPQSKFLTSVPVYARNTNTGEKIKSSQGEFRNGAIQIVPLTKQARTLRDPNTGNQITLEAGTIIPDNLMREFVANDFDFEYNTVAFGAFKPVGAQSEIPVYFLSKDTENNVFFGSNKANKELFENQLKVVQQKVKSFKNLPAEKKKEMLEKYGNVRTIFENIGVPENSQLLGKNPPPPPPKPEIDKNKKYTRDEAIKLSGGESWTKYFKLSGGSYIPK